MTDQGGRIEPFPLRRRGTADYTRAAARRSNVHGLIGVDVTEARRRIETIEAETGESLSFTAFLVFCLGLLSVGCWILAPQMRVMWTTNTQRTIA